MILQHLILFFIEHTDLARNLLVKPDMNRSILLDKGGRRSGTDRRRFSYTVHIPERRLSKDRRKNSDRRDTEYITPIKNEDAEQENAVF